MTNNEFRYTYLGSLKGELPEIFKVSQVDITKKDNLDSASKSGIYPDVAISVEKAEGKKCVRCWNYSILVGESKAHPLICQRCLEALEEEREVEKETQ